MKTYDEILDDVIGEITDGKYETEHFIVIKSAQKVKDAFREAAERYRAQVELPSDEDLYNIASDLTIKDSASPSDWDWMRTYTLNGLRWMRDHISKQLKQGI